MLVIQSGAPDVGRAAASPLDRSRSYQEISAMRWQEGRRSENVEDRRGMSPRGMAVGGGLGTLLLLILAMVFGVDPRMLVGPGGGAPGAPGGGGGEMVEAPVDPAQAELADFASAILASTEDVWGEVLPEQAGVEYRAPKLVLFSDRVESACGMASAAVGPFYCPADQQLYIDLSFYDELDQKFGAPGDFAQAYVIAHEVGHHIQTLLGTSEKVARMQQAAGSKAEANDLSVRMELQADFLAGLWAHHAQKQRPLLEPGDLEEGLQAATAIGDDRLQKQTQGYVVPDSFTHGTSAQRVRWFRRGLQSGDLADGDTFSTNDL
jgi:predicted metalloprotease